MAKKKTGPKPKPLALIKRHAVLVKFDDGEYLKLRAVAKAQSLAAFCRDRALAS